MNGVNLQLLIGNLGRAAEIRHTEGGRSKATFSVATNKKYKNREGQEITNTYWHNIVVWDPALIELVQKYLTTGTQVAVEGESITRSYQDRNGEMKYIREIKATRIVPINRIEEGGSEIQSLGNAFIIGRLTEKPALTTNEKGESICTLSFKVKDGTLPVQLIGPRAEIASRYLDKDRLAHVAYEIVSVSPFKAIGTELTLLGSRPNTEHASAGTGTYNNTATPQHRPQPAAGNAMQKGESAGALDDLPF